MSAATQEHALGSCCVDCLMLLANGEVPPDWSDIAVADWLGYVEQNTAGYEVTLGMVYGADPSCPHTNDDHDDHDQCEVTTFSRASCDVCGTTLAGERHAVTFWWVES